MFVRPVGVPTPFESVQFVLSDLHHWLQSHCRSQSPEDGHYLEDHIRIFGRDPIRSIWNGEQRRFRNHMLAAVPLIDAVQQQIAPAMERGSYLIHDQFSRDGIFEKSSALIVCRRGFVVVIREAKEGWFFETGYFTHDGTAEYRGYRGAVRKLVDSYTQSRFCPPAPGERIWLSDRKRYRTNIRFGNPRLWGERNGSFEPNRIQEW
ncbi:hypothetical protein [Tuwongella immobilis]|uniref:Uncharacterized protein n=1 Tax=Tuwongella immobilis TaxID=692036 RepID=A0A6C2YK80_9BACT|nr:hypothetical protein [Tuwongella immobilis]VIP01515.1 unnamed protein product [Tuwongella immobilis]VTR98637.1 unnamed protein product [Tuwongella immobilis]